MAAVCYGLFEQLVAIAAAKLPATTFVQVWLHFLSCIVGWQHDAAAAVCCLLMFETMGGSVCAPWDAIGCSVHSPLLLPSCQPAHLVNGWGQLGAMLCCGIKSIVTFHTWRGGSPMPQPCCRCLAEGTPCVCRCPPLSERAATTQPNPTQPNPIQAMEDGTLAIMVPLMVRALRERSTVVNRRASVIIENMCKLVRGCCKFACVCCKFAKRSCLLPSLWVKLTAMDLCDHHRKHVQAGAWGLQACMPAAQSAGQVDSHGPPTERLGGAKHAKAPPGPCPSCLPLLTESLDRRYACPPALGLNA